MLLKLGKTYKIAVKDGIGVPLVKVIQIQKISKVLNSYEIQTSDFTYWSIPEHNVYLYDGGTSIDWIALEQPSCGGFTFLGPTEECLHNWANTGLAWTYCITCDREGWNSMGVIDVK